MDDLAMALSLTYRRIRTTSTCKTLPNVLDEYRRRHGQDADVLVIAVPKGTARATLDGIASNFSEFGEVEDDRRL